MSSITRLCEKCILLNDGKVTKYDNTYDVVSSYMNFDRKEIKEINLTNSKNNKSPDEIEINSLKITNSHNEINSNFNIDEKIFVKIQYTLKKKIDPYRICVRLYSSDGICILQSQDKSLIDLSQNKILGEYLTICEIPPNFLNEGNYSLGISADIPNKKILFNSEFILNFNTNKLNKWDNPNDEIDTHWPGIIKPEFNWALKKYNINKNLR